jgi:hypothetical protein
MPQQVSKSSADLGGSWNFSFKYIIFKENILPFCHAEVLITAKDLGGLSSGKVWIISESLPRGACHK